MAAVYIGIRKDITNVSDTLLRTKRLGLRNANSRIDVSSPRPEIRADLPSLLRTNFSNTGTPVKRNFSHIKVQNLTLNGSEPNINSKFEGGNLKVSLLYAFEVWSQNFYGSESSIDPSYRRVNPQPPILMGVQDRSVKVHNNPHYGSDPNISYDEGRISEFLKSSRLNSSVRVGGQNLLYGPGPKAGNKLNLNI